MPSFPKSHNTANGSENEQETLSTMPKPRLRFLQMIRAQLLRQSEDCLYLNIFVPKSAMDGRERTYKQGRPYDNKSIALNYWFSKVRLELNSYSILQRERVSQCFFRLMILVWPPPWLSKRKYKRLFSKKQKPIIERVAFLEIGKWEKSRFLPSAFIDIKEKWDK